MAIRKPAEVKPDEFVLAFDPGGTTGMCILRYNDKEVSLVLLAQISDAHQGFYDNLYATPGGLGTPVTVVSEKWVEHGMKGVDRTPLVIEGVQYAFWPDQVVYQTPDMKVIVPDEKLKELGVWTEGKPHQMDALRHALIYLWQQEHLPTIKLLGGDEPMPQDGQGQPGQGQPGDGDGDGGESEGGAQQYDEDGNPIESALQKALANFTKEITEEETDALAAMIQETKRVYEKERDLDGAFAGYQADPGAERRTMIDEDF